MALIPKVGRKRWRLKVLIISITTFLCLGVILHLFPVWWMFSTSIKASTEIYLFPPTLWPKNPSFLPYKLFLTMGQEIWGPLQYPMYVYLKNSAIMTGGVMALQIPFAALMAYALSKLHTPHWSRFLFLVCIGTMMIPMQVSLIPSFLLLKHFPFPTMNIPSIPFTSNPFPTHNFLNSYWAIILPGMVGPFSVLLFKGFFDTIPDEIINAARLDGSSEFGILRRIILPLSKPVFAVVAYFTFSASWNNFMWPLIVIRHNKLLPLPVVLYQFQHQLETATMQQTPAGRRLIEMGIGQSGLMAMSVIQTIPVFIMFLIFREALMTGIKIRGFK